MTEILENIIDNSKKSKELKILNKVLKSSNENELRRYIFHEISEAAKYIDNEEILRLYASRLFEEYLGVLVNNKLNDILDKYLFDLYANR